MSIVGGALEAVVAAADVAKDVAVVGAMSGKQSMSCSCCGQDVSWDCCLKVKCLHHIGGQERFCIP